jgi:hypothetical protein
MNAQQRYEAELEKLRHLAAAGRDFTPEGELAWGRQLYATKQAYRTMCYEESKAKGCWQA